MTVHFMCPACGGASIAVPAVCGQEAEARVYPVITGPMEADRPKHSRAGSLYEPKPTSCATALELATRPEFVAAQTRDPGIPAVSLRSGARVGAAGCDAIATCTFGLDYDLR